MEKKYKLDVFFHTIFSRKSTLIGILCLASLFASYMFLLFFSDVGPLEHKAPATDYLLKYAPTARNILEGKGVSFQGDISLETPPGYPLFLVPIFGLSKALGVPEVGLIIFFNTIIAAMSSCFIFLIAREIFDERIAFIAGLVWSSYPLNLWFLKNPNTEVPFMLLFFAAIWFYLRSMKEGKITSSLLAGVLMGSAILVRPIILFLPPIIVIIYFLSLKKHNTFFVQLKNSKVIRFSMVFLVGNFLILTPWIIYVSSKVGRFVPVATYGPGVTIIGLTYPFFGKGDGKKILPQEVWALMERARNEHLETEEDIIHFVLQEFTSRPLPLLMLFSLKSVRSWYATYNQWWEKEIALLQLPYLLTGIIGIALSIKKSRYHLPSILCLLALIGYFWVMTFLSLSIVRYMVPGMGFVIIFSSLTIWTIISKLRLWNV